MNPRHTADRGLQRPNLASLIEAVAFFFLVLSAVMFPLIAATAGLSFRLMVLGLGVAAALFWALKAVLEQRLILPWGSLAAAGALALVAAALSALLSDCPQAALLTLTLWLSYACAFLIAVWAGLRPRLRSAAIRALCAVAVPLAALALFQYVYLFDLTLDHVQKDKARALRATQLEERDYYALVNRLKNKRAFANFALPNSLAAFLLLTGPATVALAVSARWRTGRLLLIACLALMAVALFLTFSKGGWLAGAAALALFLLWRGRAWLKRWGPPAALCAAAAAAALAAALLLSPSLRGRMAAMSDELARTVHVRTQYWTGALSMWRSRPVLGVGPGNFQNHYMGHRPVTAEETKQVHNDYLSLLADCGPVAAAGYALFWIALLIGAARRRSLSADIAPPRFVRPELVALPAGLTAVLAAGLFGRAAAVWNLAGPDTAVLVVFTVLWAAAYLASNLPPDQGKAQTTLHAALACGLLAFALHAFVDFHLYVDGLGYPAFVAAGLLAAPWISTRTVHLPNRARLPVLVAVALLGLAAILAISRLSMAEAYREHGAALVRQAQRQPKNPNAAQNIADAETAIRRACELNPYDHAAVAELARFLQQKFNHTRSSADAASAADAWRAAIRLNPAFGEYRRHLARLLLLLADLRPSIVRSYLKAYRRRAAQNAIPCPTGQDRIYLPAIVEAHLAVASARNKPQYRALYGEALFAAGMELEWRKQYRKALALNEEMIAGRAPRRQRLSGQQVQTLQSRLGLTAAP